MKRRSASARDCRISSNPSAAFPQRLIFDNATGVGRRIGDQVRLTELFRRFKAHHGFELSFCNPASGHEKGNVERKVGYIRSNLFVPVPYVDDLPIFNRHDLLEQGQKLMQKAHYKKQLPERLCLRPTGRRFLPLPRQRFNVCRYEYARADGYGKRSVWMESITTPLRRMGRTKCFNRHSAPSTFCVRTVVCWSVIFAVFPASAVTILITAPAWLCCSECGSLAKQRTTQYLFGAFEANLG